MTSKSLFLTNLRENLKRRFWVLAAFCLYFFFAYPVASAVFIQSYLSDFPNKAEAVLYLAPKFRELVGINGFALFAVSALALIAGVQGFAWLHNSVKVDMYLSLPVSKNKRFGVIYTNGVLLFTLPYLAGLLLSGIIYALMTGSMGLSIITAMLNGFLLNTLLYLCMYHLAVLCVMLTGNVGVAILAFLVLNVYEPLLRFLGDLLQSAFFPAYYSTDVSYTGLFSPFPTCVAMVAKLQNGIPDAALLKHCALLAGFLVLSGVLAFFLFLKRPSEACGKAVSFPRLKPVLKFFILIPFSLLSALFFYGLSNESAGFTVFGLLTGLLLCHAVMEVIFEFDIRAAFHKKRQLIICGVPALCIYLCFLFDVFHFNTYVPAADKLDSAAVVFTNDFIPSYLDASGYSHRGYNGNYYALDHMYLTDTQAVTALAGASLPCDYTGIAQSEDPDTWTDYVVKYRMKNGREIYRRMMINFTRHEDLIDAVYSSEQYHTGMSQLYDGEWLSENKMSASYYNGVDEYPLSESDTSEFLKLYLEEYKTLNLRQASREKPVGCIYLNFRKTDSGNYGSSAILQIYYPVYDSFQETCGWLQAKEIPAVYPLNADTVSSLRVTNDHYGIYEKQSENNTALSANDFSVTYSYEDPKRMEQILAAAYPTSQEMDQFGFHLSYSPGADSYISLNVSLKDAGDRNYDFSLHQDKIPEFVFQDTAYPGN